jgi:hypothetical protein
VRGGRLGKDPGVVDEDVDVAVVGAHDLRRGTDAAVVGHVALERHGVGALLAQRRGRRVALLRASGADDDLHA